MMGLSHSDRLCLEKGSWLRRLGAHQSRREYVDRRRNIEMNTTQVRTASPLDTAAIWYLWNGSKRWMNAAMAGYQEFAGVFTRKMLRSFPLYKYVPHPIRHLEVPYDLTEAGIEDSNYAWKTDVAFLRVVLRNDKTSDGPVPSPEKSCRNPQDS